MALVQSEEGQKEETDKETETEKEIEGTTAELARREIPSETLKAK